MLRHSMPLREVEGWGRHAGPFATEVQSRRVSYQNRKTVFRALGDICTAYIRGGSPCQVRFF